jgi:hypothetical protein
VSRLRRPFLSHRFFFVTVRLVQERRELSDADFRCLALAFNANLTDSLGFEKTKRAADLKGGGLRYQLNALPGRFAPTVAPGRPLSSP